MLTFGAGRGTLVRRGGKALSNMASDFVSGMMRGTTKIVSGKVVPRAGSIVSKIVLNNFLTSTAETAAIGFGAWLNGNVWGMFAS